MRRTPILGVVLLMASACATSSDATTTTAPPATTSVTEPSTTTTTTATTTTLSGEEITALELEADKDLIVGLWRGFSDSWFGGVEAGAQFMVDHMHPAEGCTTIEPLMDLYQWPQGASYEVVVDRDSIERDDGWVEPAGPAVGTVPEGRIYILSATTTYSDGVQTAEDTSEFHTAIVDGAALFFWECVG